MVSVYSAYSIVNKAVREVAESINMLEQAEDIRISPDVVRLEEEDFLVAERGRRLASKLTAAYDLSSYRKSFYIMENGMEELTILEQLMQPITELDLTEFNVEEISYATNRHDF